jgi:DNA ligase-1
MKFFQVAQAFKKIEEQSSRLAMTERLATLFTTATSHEAEIIAYLSLGRLRATYQGNQFNFAEKTAVKVIAQFLGVTEKTIKERMKLQGDLGSVVMAGDWEHKKELTLIEVYEALTVFEKFSGGGSQEEKITFLIDLLGSADQLSACYIIRILLGKLRLGFSDMTVIDALSWTLAGDKTLRNELEHAYNISADIGLIAHTLKEGGIAAVEKIAITIGVPIRPAAAERLPTAAAIIQKIGPCIAQPKLDGFRVQVHIDKHTQATKIHFFSRNLLDMSPMFPDILAAIKGIDVESLIVEGEALAFDDHTDSYLPFQETVKRRRKHDVQEMAIEMPLKLVLFDILYLNGESLLGHTQQDRQKILNKLFKDYDTSIILVTEELAVSTARQLEDYFVKNIASGLEGLVVKKPNGKYIPGKRNFNWIKLKRQEEGHLDDTIDAVVLGYYNGKGKRARFGIGAFLVGLYNPNLDRFETVAKIGTGLTDSGWIELKALCDYAQAGSCASNVVCHKDLTPDVWVKPELVVLVRADEITKSPVHCAGKDETHDGLALRFPRFMGYRVDKSPTDATTIHELRTLLSHQK